ncbi:family 1 glycosylhydrolase [Nocardia abscessus]|uniref:family 1 glycosylhydrolase n=1 Tax=Nocardia abscessus TaxID=120957 RepID=UPI00245769CE|nr:family 1 glycosylhydrolase [Nocardia abscessus]
MKLRRTLTILLTVVAPTIALTVAAVPPALAEVAMLGPDFQFGVAQAGFQSEGYSADSNFLRYSDEGKLPETVGNAVDFRHQYTQDIARAAELGVKLYRFSVEWARVQPRPDAYDPEGWGFYEAVIERIVAAGMTPMITLNHWVHPGWAVDRGGWNRPEMATDFIAFAKQAVDRYAWSNPLWITFNEPTEYVRRELMYGGLSPEHTMTMVDGIIRAHREIHSYIHAVQPGAQVSSNIAFMPIPGVGPALESAFPDQMIDSLDFIGVDQYYSVSATDFSLYAFGLSGQYWNQSQAPESIYYVLRYLAGRYPGKPLRIIENGLATDPRQGRADGYRRADHLRDTIYWIQRARQDGINVVSYNYWSLTDNYEWGDYTPRFGLYTVDAVTDPALTRRPTEAVQAYREITAHNGVPAAYRPTRAPVECSLVTVPDSCTHPVTITPR